MGGQGRFKHAKEMGVRCGWTKIRRGVQRQRRIGLWFLDCICGRSYKIKSLQK